MLHKNAFFGWLFLLAVFASNCSYDKVPAKQKFDCDLCNPSYSKEIVPIIQTYCSDPTLGNCHQDNLHNVHLNNFDELKFVIEGGHVQEHVIDRHEMPPPYSLGPKSLTEQQILLIYCWIKRGAQHN